MKFTDVIQNQPVKLARVALGAVIIWGEFQCKHYTNSAQIQSKLSQRLSDKRGMMKKMTEGNGLER